jgi:hypothetical protein
MNDEKEFEVKDSITVEGITSAYVSYNARLFLKEMKSWINKVEKVVQVMEDRHDEHLDIIDRLIADNKVLKARLETRKAND